MYKVRYPMTMLGRRASGKTTLLSVLINRPGYESEKTKINYNFHLDGNATNEDLKTNYERITHHENPKHTSKDTLNECLLYANANGKRIDFNIPDIAGEWFEKTEKDSKYLETFEKFQELLSKSGSLIVLISYDDLDSEDFKDIINPINEALDTLKKKNRGIVPFVVVAVTKFDLHPDFQKDDPKHNKELLEKLIKDNADLQPIKAMVCGAAGKENSALIPVSVYGSHEYNENGEMIPPKTLEPIGLVELFECAFKSMISQNAKYEFNNAENNLEEALVNLKGLLEISPYEDINKDILDKANKVEEKINNKRNSAKLEERNKRNNIITVFVILFAIITSILLYQFVFIPKQIRNAHYASGKKMLSENVDDMKLVTDWFVKIEKYRDRDKEMSELYTSVLAKYDKKLTDGIITKIDSELDKTPDENLKLKKIRSFKEENKSFQSVQDYLIIKEANIVKNLNDSAIKNVLDKLNNLPFETRIEEIYSMLEDNNQQNTNLNEKLRERLYNEEKTYFDNYFKKYIEDFKAKKLQTPIFYLDFKANCRKYLDLFKSGKYRDACEKYITWTVGFERDGIILKQVKMEVDLPHVSGYWSHWEVSTPFGFKEFNADNKQFCTWENVRIKLDSTAKSYFKVTLKDRDPWPLNDIDINWSPITKNESLLFSFTIDLNNDKGNIKMSFNIVLDEQEERNYLQTINWFEQ